MSTLSILILTPTIPQLVICSLPRYYSNFYRSSPADLCRPATKIDTRGDQPP